MDKNKYKLLTQQCTLCTISKEINSRKFEKICFALSLWSAILKRGNKEQGWQLASMMYNTSRHEREGNEIMTRIILAVANNRIDGKEQDYQIMKEWQHFEI